MVHDTNATVFDKSLDGPLDGFFPHNPGSCAFPTPPSNLRHRSTFRPAAGYRVKNHRMARFKHLTHYAFCGGRHTMALQ